MTKSEKMLKKNPQKILKLLQKLLQQPFEKILQ